MTDLEALRHVSIFTRDPRKAKAFYTEKVGLKVREYRPRYGYLALGVSKGGGDANLAVWKPDPKGWGDQYGAAMERVGRATGIAFRTSSLEKTVATLTRRKVNVSSVERIEAGGGFARFHDPDGNVLFLYELPGEKGGRAGLASLEFVTVATSDSARSGAFFANALRMRGTRLPGGDLVEYRLDPDGTAITPYTPRPDMYDDEAGYEADTGRIGESTFLMFRARDIHAVQESLLNRGVRFKRKAERAEWGGMEAEFYDPDANVYTIVQPRSASRKRGGTKPRARRAKRAPATPRRSRAAKSRPSSRRSRPASRGRTSARRRGR